MLSRSSTPEEPRGGVESVTVILAKALVELNGADLLGAAIWIEDRKLDPGPIGASRRVGVDYAGEFKEKPWRFYVEGNPHVSRVQFKS